jgi:hypothetical protein
MGACAVRVLAFMSGNFGCHFLISEKILDFAYFDILLELGFYFAARISIFSYDYSFL